MTVFDQVTSSVERLWLLSIFMTFCAITLKWWNLRSPNLVKVQTSWSGIDFEAKRSVVWKHLECLTVTNFTTLMVTRQHNNMLPTTGPDAY